MNDETEITFKLSWDKLTWGMTMFFVGLMFILGGGVVWIGISQLNQGMKLGIVMLIPGILMILSIPVVALFAPIKYFVDPSFITVWRYGPKIKIPIDNIIEVQPVELKSVMRTCAMGGAFGSYGWFHCKSLGNFRGYITRNDKTVAIMTVKGTPFIVSPDDREGFIAAVQSALAKTKKQITK